MGIQFPDLIPDEADHLFRVAIGSNLQRQIQQVGLLHDRQIKVAPHRLAQVDVLRIPCDSDDLHVRYLLEPDAFSERVRVAEKVSRYLFVDDDYLRATDPILIAKIASYHE